MKKQTAVEWLEEIFWGNEGMLTSNQIIQAKAMEKEQIIEAYEQGEAEWTPVDFRTAQGYFTSTYE